MKFRFVAIIAISSIIFYSCDWLNNKPSESSKIIGTWKLDSIATSDSSNIGLLLLAMVDNDSINYTFSKDSIYFSNEQPIAYSFNEDKKEITIKDSMNTKFNVHTLSDSLMQLRSDDSSHLFLKKITTVK